MTIFGGRNLPLLDAACDPDAVTLGEWLSYQSPAPVLDYDLPILPPRAPIDPDLWGQRNCEGVDADLFFPEDGQGEQALLAKGVCFGCVLLVECLEYAVANPSVVGIWGGTSDKERQRIRHRRERAA